MDSRALFVFATHQRGLREKLQKRPMQSVAGRTSPATWRNNANVVPCLQSQHGGRFTDDREARAVHDEVETATRANSTTRSEIQRLPGADERILTHQLDRVCSPAPNVIRLPLPSRRNSMPSCCASRHPRADGEARLSCKCAASWQRLQLVQHCHDGRVLT